MLVVFVGGLNLLEIQRRKKRKKRYFIKIALKYRNDLVLII